METTGSSKRQHIAGWIMGILPSAMLLMSAVTKFAQPEAVTKGITQFGWDLKLLVPLGIVELLSTLLYLIPQTSVLGAILVTGYLGGAIATTLRVGQGFIPTVIMGVFIWGGLYLRDTRIRRLIPLRTCPSDHTGKDSTST